MSDPNPHQRADYVVRKLEQFIRDGKSDSKTERGMSFKSWQAMARTELANCFADLERRNARNKSDLLVKRLILVASSSLVTIGFWGGLVSLDKHYGGPAAMIVFCAGAVLLAIGLELGFRRILSDLRDQARLKGFERIEEFDGQLKKLENEMRRKAKAAKEKAEALD
jgi:hypothetical protein